MDKLPMCRVCLAEDVRMYVIVNKNLRELYEKLTDNPFVTEDSRPMLACVFCCTKLKQCWRFQRKCLEAEELFAQMMHQGYEPNVLLKQSYSEFCNGFIQSPMEQISIDGDCQMESVAIKEELPAVCERLDVIIEPKEEHHNYELELENQANSFAYVDVISAQHSESDSESDVPLMKIKTEVDEEKETLRKKRRACDSQRTLATKKPKLRPLTVEDVITEEQTKHEQSDTTVIQNPQNCALTTVTKSKEPFPYTAPIPNSNLDTNCRNSGNKDSDCILYDKGIDGDEIHRYTTQFVQGKPFKCDVCQRCFSEKYTLTHHIRTHTGEKHFKCDVCQSVFSDNTCLKKHIRTHTGEKPSKCDICQRCFSDKNCLKKHIRTHTGEKPFKCEICQRCFSEKGNLTRHVRTHAVEKDFKREDANKQFIRLLLLNKNKV